MFTARKVNYKSVLTAVSAILVVYTVTVQARSSFRRSRQFTINLTGPAADSVPPRKVSPRPLQSLPPDQAKALRDSIPGSDTGALLRPDTLVQKVDTFNLKISKDSLDAPVQFQAEDSMVLDIPGEKIYIYNKAEVKFKDVSLNASVIQLDQPSQILTAYSIKDTAGKRQGVPAFKQGESAFTSDTIRYNFKTQRGLTVGTYTQEGEMFIYGEKVKRIDPQTFFAEKARFTSCNFDTPHFAFRARRVKFISEKIAVTGFVRPEFEGVPIPLGLPFGLFPLKQGRRTGILMPQPVANQQLGFGLEGLGYYKTFGEYWDATMLVSLYSYGSWNMMLRPNYRKRYRYNGSFNINYMNNKIGFKGDPDFRPPVRNFSLQWSHSVDGKARPGQNFSANVNIATSLFNQFVPNNPQQNFNNTLTSSISYQKSWAGKPFNLTMSANHNQNTLNRLFTISLPDVGFTVNNIYPFQKKNPVGSPKWYEKLGIGYIGTFRNQIAFYDSAFSVRQLLDTLQWAAQHNIPIQLSLPPLGPLQVGPSISYSETWNSRIFVRTWNPVTKKVDSTTAKGFYPERQMNFGLNFSTALFGMLNFKRKTGVQAIRHVIRPTLGVNYRPDLARNTWYQQQVDEAGTRVWFNRYNGFSSQRPPDARSGAISFTLDNNVEMKVRSKKDTSDAGLRKVRLIDGFGFNTSYNLLADSFNLSDFNFYFRNNLFDKISITAGANISPYQEDARGRLVNKFTWSGDRFRLGRFTSGFVSLNTQFSSKPKDDKKQKEKEQFQRTQRNDFDEQSREMGMIQQNRGEYADFNIPWSVNIAYALNLTRQARADFSGFSTVITQALNINGDFNLTEKWKIMAQGTFDVQTRKLQFLNTSIARDLHCWQLAINVTPIGIFRSFSISISPKSTLLRDLRINRTRFFYNLPQ